MVDNRRDPDRSLDSPDSTGITPDEHGDPNKYIGEALPDQVKSERDGPSLKPTSLDVSDSPIDSKDDSTNDLPLKTQPKTPEHRYPMFVALDDDNKKKGSPKGSTRSTPSKSPKRERKGSVGRSSPAKEKSKPADKIQPCVVTAKTIKDSNKPTTVITTVVVTDDGDQKGALPAESTKPGSVTTKTIQDRKQNNYDYYTT